MLKNFVQNDESQNPETPFVQTIQNFSTFLKIFVQNVKIEKLIKKIKKLIKKVLTNS